jgi:hypothetical protein
MRARVRSADEPFPDSRERHLADLVQLRKRMAAIVKIAFTTIAILLSLGALLVVAGDIVSASNVLVKAIWNIDDFFDGPFSRDQGVFTFTGGNAVKLDAVCNWGLAAVVYMIVGNVMRSFLQPPPVRH